MEKPMGKHQPVPPKTKADKAKANRERVAKWRAEKRAQGLRLKQFWLPDTSDPAWREEARRQSLAIANSPTEKEDQAFIDSLQDWDGLPPY
jgi:Protein  of unknown function (DUF3018)